MCAHVFLLSYVCLDNIHKDKNEKLFYHFYTVFILIPMNIIHSIRNCRSVICPRDNFLLIFLLDYGYNINWKNLLVFH